MLNFLFWSLLLRLLIAGLPLFPGVVLEPPCLNTFLGETFGKRCAPFLQMLMPLLHLYGWIIGILVLSENHRQNNDKPQNNKHTSNDLTKNR